VADGAHVDRARTAIAQQVRSIQRLRVDREHAAGGQQHAAGRIAPVAGERGQAAHRAHRIAATGGALHAVVQTDRRRARVPVVVRELLHLGRRDAAQLRHARRVERLRAFGELLEAERVAGDVVAIEPVLAHQHVDQAQGERAVGARQQRDVLVALLGGERAVRVDRDQLGAAPLGLLRAGPQVQVAGDRVGAPEDDEPGVGKALHLRAGARAERVGHRLRTGGGADGAVEQAGTELVEEALRHALALHQPHGAGVAVRHDALRVDRGDLLQARGNVVERAGPSSRARTGLRPCLPTRRIGCSRRSGW
jgi:hypothetical protein